MIWWLRSLELSSRWTDIVFTLRKWFTTPAISPDRTATHTRKKENYVKKYIHGISALDRYPKRRGNYYIKRDFKSLWQRYNYPPIVANGVSTMDRAALGGEYHFVNFLLLKWQSRIYDPLHLLIKTLQFNLGRPAFFDGIPCCQMGCSPNGMGGWKVTSGMIGGHSHFRESKSLSTESGPHCAFWDAIEVGIVHLFTKCSVWEARLAADIHIKKYFIPEHSCCLIPPGQFACPRSYVFSFTADRCPVCQQPLFTKGQRFRLTYHLEVTGEIPRNPPLAMCFTSFDTKTI